MEVYRQGLNLSRAASALHTSQPAITRMIRSLEAELEIEILVRRGRKISSIHENALELIPRARSVLQAVEDLQVAAAESKSPTRGSLRVATSHLHVHHALVEPVRRFSAAFPDVHIDLMDCSTEEIAQLVSSGDADMGISRMQGHVAEHLLKLDAYPISRCVITPHVHPLLSKTRPSLQDISRYPLIHSHNRFEKIAPKWTPAQVEKARQAFREGRSTQRPRAART